MAKIEFDLGRWISGVLRIYDPEKDEQRTTPATLTFTDSGVELEASMSHDTLFAGLTGRRLEPWFGHESEPPVQCLFEAVDGTLTLSGISLQQRRQGSRVETARFRVREAVLSPTLTGINDPVTFDKLFSNVAGLSSWWRASSIAYNVEQHPNGLVKGVKIETRDVPALEWKQGEATMRLEMLWHSDSMDDSAGMSLSQAANISSEFPDPRSADAHLDEQWKVRSLLVALHGYAFPYRDHQVTSSKSLYTEMPPRSKGEEPRRIASRHPFVTSRTVRERTIAAPSGNVPERPILFLNDVGVEGLGRWSEMWDARWERLINPVVAALSRHRPYMEDQVMAAGIFLDGWGPTAPKADGEEMTYASRGTRTIPTFATYVFRALAQSRGDWSDAASSRLGLARAIRRIYTAVKHAENEQPDPLEMSLTNRFMLLLVRMIIARRVDEDGALVEKYAKDWSFRQTVGLLRLNEVRINDDGDFAPWKESDEKTEEATTENCGT